RSPDRRIRHRHKSAAIWVADDLRPAVCEEVGSEMIDAGALEIARLLEPVALHWIHLAYRCGLGRDFAFRLMRRR
ncbi:MAG: hypothetical protein WCE51_09640, partial [Chthoniobacterales bacterium]